MARGVSFERVLDFFDNAPLRVAQAALTQALIVVKERQQSEAKSARRQADAVSTPRKRRVRGANATAATTTVTEPVSTTVSTTN